MTQRTSTHCRKGHELTPDNVYIHGGYRKCKTCVKAYNAYIRTFSATAPDSGPAIEQDIPRSGEEIERVTLFLHKIIDIIDRATARKSA